MQLREHLLPHLAWKLGNGQVCKVYGEPWCPGITQIPPPTVAQAKLTISALVDVQTDTWDLDQLVQRFGYFHSVNIAGTIAPPCMQGEPNRLLFVPAKDGVYSVKKGYQILKGGSPVGSHPDHLWKLLWKKRELAPQSEAVHLEAPQQCITYGENSNPKVKHHTLTVPYVWR